MSLVDDQNKTELTKEVTLAMCQWLAERGCKPIATECCIDAKWIADIATVLNPTRTELQDLKLVSRCPAWKQYEDRERWIQNTESLMRTMTVVVEVKTSRSDFLRDKKWKAKFRGDLNYIACPLGLVMHTEIPEGWGILTYDPPSGRTRILRVPVVGDISDRERANFIYSVACRCFNVENYSKLKEVLREQRSRSNEYTNVRRVAVALRAAMAIIEGKHDSVAGALEAHGFKNLSAGDLERIETFWNRLPSASV